MEPESKTLTQIESCLARLNAGDASAWDELFEHAFKRLLSQCERIVRQRLNRPNPLITENAVLAESYQRLCTALKNDRVKPKTAQQFFGLTARNIGWQIQDMLRKRSEQTVDDDLLTQVSLETGSSNTAEDYEKWELFWSGIESLTEEERDVFDLVWINELSQYETADALGKTRNQVDTIWRRIKIKIGKACKDYAGFEL